MEPEYEQAPTYEVGKRSYFCVEYPGIVKNIDRVLQTIGGEKAVARVYEDKDKNMLELRYRPTDPFCHVINGSTLPTSRLLVKVTRRRRKDQPIEEAQMTTEVLGTIPYTCRFRGMADFQYLVPQHYPARQLQSALVTGDVEKIRQFKLSLDDDDVNNLRAIPPPVFSGMETPFKYDYKQNPHVVRVRVQQADGSYVTKLVNLSTSKIVDYIALAFDAKKVPTEPPAGLQALSKEALIVKNKLDALFRERPLWSKFALRHHLDPTDIKELKETLPYVAYVFQNGPWRECWVKYGLDPRTDQSYALYQQMDIRLGIESSSNAHIRGNRRRTLDEPKQRGVIQEQSSDGPDHKHIFDGQNLPPSTAWFQICDITDPDFAGILHTKKYIRPGPPDKAVGFFYRVAFNTVRQAMRTKYIELRRQGTCSRIPDLEKGLEAKVRKEIEAASQKIEVASSTQATSSNDQLTGTPSVATSRYAVGDEEEEEEEDYVGGLSDIDMMDDDVDEDEVIDEEEENIVRGNVWED